MTVEHSGKVYLVGAGPGDPGLITVRGRALLETCEVVLHDRLVAPELVDLAPANAERIFVGKEAGAPSMPQASIDALMVERARAGQLVVRLKGGDPYVFGRGADEAQALAAAGVDFEVVPGVTAAVAVPAYAGIPVTHSGLSSSVAILTAHSSADRPGAQDRWDHIALGAETLVLLMGVGQLGEVTGRLIEAGRSGNEPAAVIEWGTTAHQRTVTGTLRTISKRAEEAGIGPPATTIVGPVVNLKDAIDWFGARPLFGRRVVVTRALGQGKDLVTALTDAGAEVIHLPTIAIEPPSSTESIEAAIDALERSDVEWVVFSSRNGVDRFFGYLHQHSLDARAFGPSKVAAVGPKTADALAAQGVQADLVPESFTGAALIATLGDGSGRLFLPRPEDAPRKIVDELAAAGWEVLEASVYRTVPARPPEEALGRVRNGEFDSVTFTSASTARNFASLGDDLVARANEKTVVAIGPETAAEAERCGMRVSAVPEQHTTEGIVSSLLELGAR